MKVMKLYTGGGVSFSPLQREGSVESNYVRIVADNGRGITNGDGIATVIDILTSDIALWSDCEAPEEPHDEPVLTDTEVLNIILGGEV